MKCVRLLVLLAGVSLSMACSHKPAVDQTATATPASVAGQAHDDRIEGFYIQPNVNFTRYQRMILTDINLRDINIRQPEPRSKTPWVLSDSDRQFYRMQYIDAVVSQMIADGRFATALDAGDDVLRLEAAIVEIAPVDIPADQQSPAMRAYTRGMATMTIALDVLDSRSGELLATLVDRRDMGHIWDDNNRLTPNLQIRTAFMEWLAALRFYLDDLTVP